MRTPISAGMSGRSAAMPVRAGRCGCRPTSVPFRFGPRLRTVVGGIPRGVAAGSLPVSWSRGGDRPSQWRADRRFGGIAGSGARRLEVR